MAPKILTKDDFTVMGVVGHFASAAENFGPLWNAFMAHHDQIVPLSADQGYYGVYLGADHTQPIDYIASMAVRAGANAPQGVEVRVVPAAQYAVFECAFSEIGRTYGYIWDEWLPSSAYEQDKTKLGFDYFAPDTTSGDSPMAIYLPIVEKDRE
jgi:predicted transcriptional regulator YdeE